MLVFHATGTGGRTMESLIESGRIAGVLDVTTTEWADELVGGVLAAGPTRLEAAARHGVPAIVAPGCLDMVNFWAPETVPEVSGRRFYQHNPNITLMRTTPDECRRLGRDPRRETQPEHRPGHRALAAEGVEHDRLPRRPFWWPEANQALFDALKKNLRPDIPVVEIDANVNDRGVLTPVCRDLAGTDGRDLTGRVGGGRIANRRL